MATPASTSVTKKASSPAAKGFARCPTLEKLQQIAANGKRSASSLNAPRPQSVTPGGDELLRILGRQRVRVDKNAIHFVSEPAQRRGSVVRSTPTKNTQRCAKRESYEKKSAEEKKEDEEAEPEDGMSISRTESIFRMAPAAAGRTIIARVGAPRADVLTSQTLKNNPFLLHKFSLEDTTEQSEEEQEDWGGEDDAGVASGHLQERTKTDAGDAAVRSPQEPEASLEEKEQIMANVAAALHAEIEQTLKEGKEAVVTTEPYDVDEPKDITLAVTKIQDMAAAVERLTAEAKSADQGPTPTSNFAHASFPSATGGEYSTKGKRDVALTEADFNVLESLQEAYVSANLIVWLDHMQTIYAHGVRLMRVNVLGKAFIRIVTIQDGCIQLVPANARAKSQRVVALTLIETVTLGKDSREFRALRERIAAGEEVAEADPPATACAVILLSRNRTVSLVFMDELQRNGFVFALRVWSKWAKAALREMEWGP